MWFLNTPFPQNSWSSFIVQHPVVSLLLPPVPLDHRSGYESLVHLYEIQAGSEHAQVWGWRQMMRVETAAEQTWLDAAVECAYRTGSPWMETGSLFWMKGQKIPDEAPCGSFWSVSHAQIQVWRGELHSLHSKTKTRERDKGKKNCSRRDTVVLINIKTS